MRKKLVAFLLIIVMLVSSYLPAYATPSYTYNSRNQPVPSPPVYQTQRTIDGLDLPSGPFSNPTHLFADRQHNIFVLDAGNQRVVVLDSSFEVTRVIDEFVYNGEVTYLSRSAQGLFYHDALGVLYIADTENNRIILSDLYGNIYRIFGMPDTDMLNQELEYRPTKIVVDNLGVMFVISSNVNDGIIMISESNEFLGIFGKNQIRRTMAVMMEFARRRLFPNARTARTFQPTQITNIFWSHNRFIYAVSPRTGTVMSEVARFNAVGETTLTGRNNEIISDFGNLVAGSDNTFLDITVDRHGIFTVLDASGKLFQYDANANLIGIFGGSGNTRGTFSRPVSVEALGDDGLILVLDSAKNTITVMEPTYYGRLIRENIVLFNVGKFQESMDGWRKVLSINPNYYLAHTGIGMVYYQNREYRNAMDSFRMAYDRDNYSRAKRALLHQNTRDNFPLIVAGVMVLFIWALGGKAIRQLTKNQYRRLKRAA